MDAIFDIADEAYNHKQNLDSVANDERNWREWLQLFKEDQPIANTHNNLPARRKRVIPPGVSVSLKATHDLCVGDNDMC